MQVEASDLPAEFGADGPSGAGNQYDFALERALDLAFFEAYEFTAEKVFDRHFADLGRERRTFDDLSHRRHGAEGHACFLAELQNPRHLCAGCRWKRNQNQLNVVLGGQSGQFGAGAENRHSLNPYARLGEVVINEAHNRVVEAGIRAGLS